MYRAERQGDIVSDFEFKINGLKELQNDIEKCFKKYPEESSKKIYNLAGRFTKDVNAKFPSKYGNGKRALGKSWKREREKTMFAGYTVQINVRNAAPHFHLVENGHEGVIPESQYAAYIKNKGQSASAEKRNKMPGKATKGSYRLKTIGFVPGKHYCEKTRNEWQRSFPEEVEQFVDKMLKDNRL